MATQTKAARNFTFSDGSSNKFWKIELDGSTHTVTFGRVGTSGQTQTKEFDDDASALGSYSKLIAEKLKKGYVEDGASPGVSVPTAAVPTTATAAASAAVANAKKSVTKRASTKKAIEEPPVHEEGSSESRTNGEQPTAPSPASTTKVVIAADRKIALDPEDWFRAAFRPRQRLERATPTAFDREECVRRLSNLKTATYGWDTRWQDLKLTTAMSPEEAHFWMLAMTTPRDRDAKMADFAQRIAKLEVTGTVDFETACTSIGQIQREIPEELMLALSILLTVEQFLELLLEHSDAKQAWSASMKLQVVWTGFARYVVPYTSDAQLELLRKRVRTDWDPTQQPANDYSAFPAEYYAAATLGMHDEVFQVISSWPDDRYTKSEYADHYQSPQNLVFGLGSAAQVESEWRRLKLRVRSPEDARALLACTEYSTLDCIAESILAVGNKEQAEALIKVLALVHAPEAAVPMLMCKLSAKAPAIARDWLDTYVAHAIAGLIETAAGRSKLADAAMDYLRGAKRKGHADLIAASLSGHANDVVARIRQEVVDREEKTYQPLDDATTPNWLKQAIDESGTVKRKALPGWVNIAMLPPLTIGERRLNDDQMTKVLQILVATPVTTRNPLLVAIRQQIDKHVRDALAWKLFQLWQDDGTPSSDKWAMGAIGHIGDDGCVLKITPLIRAWPGESQHQRAVFGLECLRAVGSNTALMQLSGIAQKLKFKGLKTKAELFVDEIAKEKGLTRAELEDRVVPDCGLDENGRREFSFGPRSFSFVLSGDLKAMVRDADGKLKPDLPKPGAKDDEAVANSSVAEWKLLKKQIKEVATIQAGRLENAMVTGRRWTPDDFETLIVRHPLMTHLAQKLIWAAYDESGRKTATFRVTEERDYADVDESSYDTRQARQIGVVHSLEMTADERAAWGQVLGDYEIVTPFPQLGREVYLLKDDEVSLDELTRYKGLQLVAPTLVFTLEKMGWVRGVGLDGGGFDEHSKQFPAAGLTAVVGYEGSVAMGYIDPNEMLTLETVVFCDGMRAPSGYGDDMKNRRKLGQVSPIVISEVLADMQVLKGKAK